MPRASERLWGDACRRSTLLKDVAEREKSEKEEARKRLLAAPGKATVEYLQKLKGETKPDPTKEEEKECEKERAAARRRALNFKPTKEHKEALERLAKPHKPPSEKEEPLPPNQRRKRRASSVNKDEHRRALEALSKPRDRAPEEAALTQDAEQQARARALSWKPNKAQQVALERLAHPRTNYKEEEIAKEQRQDMERRRNARPPSADYLTALAEPRRQPLACLHRLKDYGASARGPWKPSGYPSAISPPGYDEADFECASPRSAASEPGAGGYAKAAVAMTENAWLLSQMAAASNDRRSLRPTSAGSSRHYTVAPAPRKGWH
eukprot:TRINITY_DN43933_c0_g1_i1.p1 TRINITY_DN43933_c0_g1~~TRINITY_DN43933_c0_g1_i1.p1  ORF type:complete len:323 (-),score=99.91 TRINITY_DN43933_c0_g1_i1:297-1265(-)